MKFPKFQFRLERYNQILLALIGSALVIVFLVSVVFPIVASWFRSDKQGVPVEVVADPDSDDDAAAAKGSGAPKKGRVVKIDLCLPVDVVGSPYQLIRVGMDRIVIKGKAFDMQRNASDSLAMSSFGSYKPEPGPNLGNCESNDSVTGNVMIRDKRNGAMRLLLPQNAAIHDMEAPEKRGKPRDESEERNLFPPQGAVYWEIGFSDSNSDGTLNDEDDIGAFFSDADGSHLVRVTPPNSRVLAKAYDEKRGVLTAKIVSDTNGDKTLKLDGSDAVSIIEISVPERRMLGVIVENTKWRQQTRKLPTANAAP